MANHPDVVILGGGVIGLTTAYFLAREGVQVAVLDKGDFGQEASWAGAGILPEVNPDEARAPFERFRADSIARFPALSAELRELTGIDNGYLQSGGLEFLRTDDRASAAEWHMAGRYQPLDDEALSRLEPLLARGLGPAHYLPGMAQVRNPRHMKALLAACQTKGVRLHPNCAVHGFVTERERVTAVKTLSGVSAGSRFLIAAGAWTDALLEGLGWRPGIYPVRGQIALLNTGAAQLHRILLWGSRYLVPRPDGRVLVGSTQENAGYDKGTTAAAIADLLTLAGRLVPLLAHAQVERCWAGLRPGSPDGLPFLGPVPGRSNLYVAAGHFRVGIQLSPGTALVMKECLLGQPLSFSLEPYRLDRPLPAVG
jgi:glycine oxidase